GPVTGYGYIERGDPVRGSERSFRVRRFVEKPDLETARRYFSSDRFFWNSGMFALRPKRFLEELQRFRPEILAAAKAALEAGRRGPSTSHTAGSIGPGATTRASMQASASRSSASWSNRAKRSRCRCITTGRSTGWWCRARRGLHEARR